MFPAVFILCGCSDETILPTSFEAYAEGHTQLIFKTVSFNQYVIKGTRNSIDQLEQRKVFLLKGTGKFYFDLSLLEQDGSEEIDPEHPVLYLKVKQGVKLPKCYASLDIDINTKDIYPVEQVLPSPIDESQAKQVAKKAAVVEGGLGAWIGGTIGKTVAPLIDANPIKQLGVSAGSGAVLGLIGGADGYIRTKNFICGKTLTRSDGPQEVDEFINEAKAMIAAELLDIADQKSNPSDQFSKEIQEQLSLAMNGLGWEKTVINFK